MKGSNMNWMFGSYAGGKIEFLNYIVAFQIFGIYISEYHLFFSL